MIEALEQSTGPTNQVANRIADRFHEIASMFSRTASSDYPQQLKAASDIICGALRNNRKLLVFGNGGSAADAQHICGELVVRFQTNRRALPAISLCGDTAVMTACGNDFSYEEVFARQIEALGAPGDVALGLSTSGNSRNVVRAFEVARDRGLHTILMTGTQCGKACALSEVVLAAPGNNTARIQELHLASYHMICELLDSEFSQEER